MLIHFIFGLLGAYIGGIPFGPLNLSVVDITMRHGRTAGARFALGASIIEIGEAAIAVIFGNMIALRIGSSPTMNLLVIGFLVLTGLYFIIRKESPKIEQDPRNNSAYVKRGIFMAFINPQAIPYWLLVLTISASFIALDITRLNLVFFLAGVFIGKYFILSTFGMLSRKLKETLGITCAVVSKSIGIFLVLLGIFQGLNYYYWKLF